MPKSRRTTHRSTRGKKLYAKRNKAGRFEDIQSYKRAHGADIKRRSKEELAKKVAAKLSRALVEGRKRV